MILYGHPPRDIGPINLHPTEMMFWQDLPVHLPYSDYIRLPKNANWAKPIISAALSTTGAIWVDRYVYVCIKTLFTSPGCMGNRPGWHSDGFGTNDINFIWYDSAPTEFMIPDELFSLPDDDAESLVEMAKMEKHSKIVTYPVRHLLRLDPCVIHRSPVDSTPGMRSFVKVTISERKFNLEGNSHNYELDYSWPMKPRKDHRNDPGGKQ